MLQDASTPEQGYKILEMYFKNGPQRQLLNVITVELTDWASKLGNKLIA